MIRQLQAALSRIERYGWVQGYIGSKKEGFCILGSLADQNMGIVKQQEVEELLITFLPESYDSLSGYNDDSETEVQDVKRLLRKAIASRRRKASR